MKLYILRHGEAATPAGGGEKSLTPRGREEVARVAQILCVEQPQIIIHSPKQRARQTAAMVNEAGLAVSSVLDDRLLPESSASAVQALLASHSEQSILLVSHLPLVARLVSWFTSGNERDYPLAGYSTAGLVAIELDYYARGCGTLDFYALGPNHTVSRP